MATPCPKRAGGSWTFWPGRADATGSVVFVTDGGGGASVPCGMAVRYIPLALKHSPTPQVEHFALLAGLEAAVRGTLVSAMPLAVYEALGDAQGTSAAYFAAGVVALCWGLMVPWATRHVPRRWAYSGGCLLYVMALALAIIGTRWSVPLALICNAMATATTFVCFNAYVLDYVDRSNLGRSQSVQLVYAAAPWSIGPLAGVWLHHQWAPAPFPADRVLDPASGQRQADLPRQTAGGQPTGVSDPVFPSAKADRGLVLCGDAQLRLVGLCGLSADLLH